MDFRMMPRRYGPTLHLTPAGELDLETRTALDEVQAGRQPQPRRLLDLTDALYPSARRNGNRSGPTQLLRRSLPGSAAAARVAPVARARQAAPRRAAVTPPSR